MHILLKNFSIHLMLLPSVTFPLALDVISDVSRVIGSQYVTKKRKTMND